MNWKNKVDDAVQILLDSQTLDDAVGEMNYRWDTNITKGALRKALKRYDYHPPSEYLGRKDSGQQDNGDDVDDPISYKEPENAWLNTNYEEKVYVFKWNFDEYEVSFNDMENILVRYSDVEPGKGMTRNEIAHHYQSHDKKWAIPNFLKWMFRTIGFTKAKFPCPPHRLFDGHEEILTNAYERKDAMVRGERNRNIVKEQSKIIESLYEEINDITRSISMTDETLEEKEVQSLDLSGGGNFREGYRVSIPSVNDLHNGKLVEDLPYSKQDNLFDEDIFQDRLETLCKAISIEADRKDFDLAYIAGLGDYFEALLLNMRPYQYKEAYSHGQEQYRAVKNAWLQIIDTAISSYDCDVKVVIQGGNHDRLTEDRDVGSEEVLAFQLCEHLSDYFRHDDGVDISFGSAIVSTVFENGVNLISMHGHQSKPKRTKDFDQFIRMHGYDWAKRYIVMQGHWHTFKVLTGKGFRAFWMPAFCGNDRFSREQLIKGSSPEMAMLDICGHHDRIVGPYNLNYELDKKFQ